MKKYMTLMGCLGFLFIGMNSSLAQEVKKEQSEASMKQAIIDHDSAKKQTFDLHQLLDLDGEQVAKVHDMFLVLDKKQSLISVKSEKTNNMERLDKIESLKTEKLKEILTEAQFEIYLKSVKKE